LYRGGLESLFSNKRNHAIQLPTTTNKTPTIASLVDHLSENHLAGSTKKELFILDGTVRPGILVLINDADWELEGEGACELHAGDEVVFVSTLHGG